MKIAYLTWGETPRSYGIFGSQVIQQIKSLGEHYEGEIEIHLLCFLPVIHSGLVRERLAYLSELQRIRLSLSKFKFKIFALPIPQNFVYPKQRSHWLLFFTGLTRLKNYICKHGIQLLHCRSMHAGYAAVKVKKQFELSCKIIYDIRSSWPETMALLRKYDFEHPEYKFFKKIEKFVVINSDAIVSISPTMTQLFNKTYGINCRQFYLSASVGKLSANVSCDVGNLYSKTRLIYVGALEENGWHKISVLKDLFMHIQKIEPNVEFKIVSTSSHNQINAVFADAGLKDLTITSTKSMEELSKHLNAANLACLTAFVPQSQAERIFCEGGFSVKTTEYLSAGLPVLVNRHIGGVCEYVEANSIGLKFDPVNHASLTKNSMQSLLNLDVRNRAIATAKRDFDYSVNSRKYFDLYEELLQKDC